MVGASNIFNQIIERNLDSLAQHVKSVKSGFVFAILVHPN